VTFFSDDVIDLGALPDSSALPVDFNLAYTSKGGGDGFDSDLVFGAGAAQAPAAAKASGAAQLDVQPRFVPEPSTWVLMIAGGAALLGVRKRRRISA
jgi:hypothetical protein